MNSSTEYSKEYLRQLRYYALQALSEGQRQALAGWPIEGEYGLRRYLASRSIEAFAKLYFPTEFTLPFAPIHHQMLADMQEVRDRLAAGLPGLKLARAIPRNHAKSTFYSRLLPLHGFLYGWSSLTVLLGNNDDSAKRLVGNIKVAIETNPLLAMDFPNIKGSSWGIERLENNIGGVITSYGVGSGAVRGISTGESRPSLVILDDIDDERSVRSAVELANNIEWFDKTVLALGDNVHYTTSFIAVGTIIRKTSLLKYILDSTLFHRIIAKAVMNFASNDELWQQWQEYIIQMARDNYQPRDAYEDSFYQQHKTEMLAGTQVLWDRPDAYRQAMLLRLHDKRSFQSEQQNEPIDDGNLIGSIVKVASVPNASNEWHLLGSLDSSIKGSDANDPSAWVEVLFNRSTKQMIVSYVDSKKRSYAQTINDVSQRILQSTARYQGIFVETNSAGELIADAINQQIASKYYMVTKKYNTLPKAERIGVLTQYMDTKQLVFYEGIQPQMFDELDTYPMKSNTHHYDSLDALATIVMYLKDQGLLDLIGI